MKKLLFYITAWFDWRKRVSGRTVIDWRKGAGYYLPGQFSGYSRNIGMNKTFVLISGRSGVYKLIYVDTFSDPEDMVKESGWQLLGYVGRKQFSEMTFREYLEERWGAVAL